MIINNPLFTQVNTTVDKLEDDFYTIYCNSQEGDGTTFAEIKFQTGPVKEAGVNGCFIPDLLLIALTRLQEFQQTPYACRENACAITKIEEAVMWLRKRTLDRQARGVEGTSGV